MLELELLHSGFVGRDGGAFDADAVFLDGFRGVEGDLVVCFVSVGEAEVVVFQVDIEVGVDELVLRGEGVGLACTS